MTDIVTQSLLAYYMQNASRLPEGYREVEYLQSTGAQWIDTGLVPDWDKTFDAEVTAHTTWNSSQRYFLLGNFIASTSYIAAQMVNLEVQYNSYRLYFDTGKINKYLNAVYVSGSNTYTFSCHCDVGAFNVSAALSDASGILTSGTATKTSASVTGILTLQLFLDYRYSTFQGISIHSCNISQDSALVRNFVPCVRIADNKPGMYDLCGSTCALTNSPFYINAGTGADFYWKELDGPAPDEVWYWADSQVTLYSSTNVSSHTFADGKGVVKYTAPLTSMPNTLRETPISRASLPQGITGMAFGAFNACGSLESITLPDSIATMDNSVFSNCKKLNMRRLPTKLTTLGTGVFQNDEKLALSTLPDGLVTIGTNCFVSCALTISTIPASVSTIGRYAFEYCKGITSLTFLGTPTDLASDMLQGCTNLTDIYVPWSSTDAINANAPWGAPSTVTIHYNYTP